MRLPNRQAWHLKQGDILVARGRLPESARLRKSLPILEFFGIDDMHDLIDHLDNLSDIFGQGGLLHSMQRDKSEPK